MNGLKTRGRTQAVTANQLLAILDMNDINVQ